MNQGYTSRWQAVRNGHEDLKTPMAVIPQSRRVPQPVCKKTSGFIKGDPAIASPRQVQIEPPSNAEINCIMKIKFIGHSYHQATNSSRFFSKILECMGPIDYAWDASWVPGGAEPDLSSLAIAAHCRQDT